MTNIQTDLRELAGESHSKRIREAMLIASDRIDELEMHVKMINRLGNLSGDGKLDLRVKIMEDDIKELKKAMGSFATKLDLETVQMEIRSSRY